MDVNGTAGVGGGFDPAEHADEARERWGTTEAYQESTRRTASYSDADWERFRYESEASMLALADALAAGLPPDSAQAMDAAERARLLIDAWFYPCSREMHLSLGEMYIADPRFTATYEKIRPGLARYVRDAIEANARRA